MSYLALARKWRPRTFAQLVGQDHINKALINALNLQRLHHAYLFTGTRGVGKTSIARILAKSLNCEQGVSSNPCLQCDACLAIEQGRFIDLIEIDGASKTRVEDTRELLDNVQYAPSSGRYKIYLIDEVHMLSTHSFNALLKTLEEPPSHVKFILATTDPQKLPITVLSRCLQFNLKHLPETLISEQLRHILNEEHVAFEEAALDILAKAADGSMRDALSLLDQAITGCDKQITEYEVKSLLGYTHQDYALQLLNALSRQDPENIVNLCQKITFEGGHFQYTLNQLLNHLHQITLFQHLGTISSLTDPSPDIQQLSDLFTAEDAQLFYQIALKGKEEIHLAPTLAIGFSMILFRMLTFRPVSATAIPKMAYQSSSSAHTIPPAPLNQPISLLKPAVLANTTPSAPDNAPVCYPESRAESKDELAAANWSKIVSNLKLTGLALNAIERSEFESLEDYTLSLKVERGHLSVFTPGVISRIESALTDYYQTKIRVQLKQGDNVQATPAHQKESLAQKKLQHAEEKLHTDPVFQQIQSDFSADLVRNSIVSLKNEL